MPRLAAVLLFTAAATATAQVQQPDAPLQTLKLQTTVVAAAAVVRDPRGQPVGGLTKDDFQLTEDGKPTEIRYFSQGTELPLTLTLLIDTSGSQRNLIVDETAASMIFFRTMLQTRQDRAALVQFDSGIVELQPMTPSVDNLERQLDYLSTPHASMLPANQSGTLLFDAIVSAAGRVATGPRGRRAMVLLTDGGDSGSKRTLTQALASAQQHDIAIYSVFYAESDRRSGGNSVRTAMPDEGRANLEKLSSATGGKVYDVAHGQSLRQIYAEIAQDLRLEYQLGFRPPEDSAPGSYHKLQLRTTDKKYKVQTRQGFYVPAA